MTKKLKRKVTNMILFANGNIAAFDESGHQIPELQESAIRLWSDFARRNGFDVDGCTFKTQTPDCYGTIRESLGGIDLVWRESSPARHDTKIAAIPPSVSDFLRQETGWTAQEIKQYQESIKSVFARMFNLDGDE